jgi:hypothetical protein
MFIRSNNEGHWMHMRLVAPRWHNEIIGIWIESQIRNLEKETNDGNHRHFFDRWHASESA